MDCSSGVLSLAALLLFVTHSAASSTVTAVRTSTVVTPEPTPSSTVLLQSTSPYIMASSTLNSTVLLQSTSSHIMATPVTMTPAEESVFEMNITTYGNNTCDPYVSGGHCQPILGGFPTVITNWSRSDQMVARQDNDLILNVVVSFGSTEECISLAFPLLCRYAFPTCDPAFREPTYQPICRRDCQSAQFFVCREPWLQMEALIEVLDLGGIDQPNCDPLKNPNGGDAPMCISTVNIYQGEVPQFLQTGPDCYSGHGRGYNGTVNVTRGGLPCQQWDLDYPHQHLLRYENHSELEGGHNYCRNPGERGERPWCFTTDRDTRWDYCDIEECSGPACENYQGSVCFRKGMIGYDKVYIKKTYNDMHSLTQQMDYEEAMVNLLNGLERYEEECREVFLDLLCATNFPSCDPFKATPTPIRPCRSFCESVHTKCEDDIEGIKAFLGVISIDPVEIIFNCSTLPDSEAGDLPECFAPIVRLQSSEDESTETCYNTEDKGFSYTGTVSVTASGKECQMWSAQSPHQHTLTPTSRVYLSRHNYCRNPEQRGDKPWCFTTDPNTRWEYCDVPSCDSDVGPTSELTLTNIITIAVVVPGGVMLAIFVMLLLICVTWCCARKGKASSFALNETESHHYVQNVQMAPVPKDWSALGPLYAKNPLTSETQIEYDGVQLPEIPRDTITYTGDLGQGHFGVVVQAEAECIGPENKPRTVAVKVLKVGASAQVKKEFFREAALMHGFDHSNILKLYGVCIEQEPLCMVFEYMEKGDLNDFLRHNSPKPPQPGLPIPQLVEFSIQIAAGLEYLSQNHYVHRDMATRNCLISATYQVKISDFGLSQDIYSSDYFTLGDSEMLPIRWMPPEAILYSKFTTQSDIWSFGVVLWEIFSFGIQPYYTMSNEEVVQYVRDGNWMKCPDDCPSELYDLMLDCWAMEPSDRPTAAELHAGLRRWSPNLSALIQVGQGASEYQNMAVVREYAQQGTAEEKQHVAVETNGVNSSTYDHLQTLEDVESENKVFDL